MSRAVKNLLVYADGRVVETKDALRGFLKFVVPEMVDGDLWLRTFNVVAAQSGGGPPITMIGVERSFELDRTKEQLAEDRAERRDHVMGRIVKSILGREPL